MKVHCCTLDCKNDAKYLIQGPGVPSWENYWHACQEHVDEMTYEDDIVEEIP